MHIRRWGVAGVNGAGLDPLLNRIARNLLIDRYRRTSPHIVPLDSADEIQDPAQDPSEEVARRQRGSAVRSAIRSLPTRHQKAITFSMSGLSPEEVGKELGIGRNAADALLHRARRSLREHLAPVRDGMWGLALLVRIRWDRLTRRAGFDDRVAGASIMAATNAAVTVATAAIVAVLTVTGGGGGPPAYARAFSTASRNASAVAGMKGVAGATGAVGGSGSGALPPTGLHSYSLGPTHGTYNANSSDNHVTVPGKDPSAPLVDVHYKLLRQPAGSPPAAPTARDRVCKVVGGLCGGA